MSDLWVNAVTAVSGAGLAAAAVTFLERGRKLVRRRYERQAAAERSGAWEQKQTQDLINDLRSKGHDEQVALSILLQWLEEEDKKESKAGEGQH